MGEASLFFFFFFFFCTRETAKREFLFIFELNVIICTSGMLH